jgi:hypothetical protein
VRHGHRTGRSNSEQRASPRREHSLSLSAWQLAQLADSDTGEGVHVRTRCFQHHTHAHVERIACGQRQEGRAARRGAAAAAAAGDSPAVAGLGADYVPLSLGEAMGDTMQMQVQTPVIASVPFGTRHGGPTCQMAATMDDRQGHAGRWAPVTAAASALSVAVSVAAVSKPAWRLEGNGLCQWHCRRELTAGVTAEEGEIGRHGHMWPQTHTDDRDGLSHCLCSMQLNPPDRRALCRLVCVCSAVRWGSVAEHRRLSRRKSIRASHCGRKEARACHPASALTRRCEWQTTH